MFPDRERREQEEEEEWEQVLSVIVPWEKREGEVRREWWRHMGGVKKERKILRDKEDYGRSDGVSAHVLWTTGSVVGIKLMS